VEKSLQTSHNLMSIVTGSLGPSRQELSSSGVAATGRPPLAGGHRHDTSLISRTRVITPDAKQAAGGNRGGASGEHGGKSSGTPPAPVSDIMIKEVGSNWVSLCWKRPPVTNRGGSPVLTYKVILSRAGHH
jgi:hypothetical protein